MEPRYVTSAPDLTADDIRPGRYAEHALFERVCAVPGILVLGLFGMLAALHRFRHGPLARRLSLRLTALLRPGDWVWIVAGGVVLPVVWHVAITRFTTLSAREWSLTATHFVQAPGQAGATVLLWLLLPLAIARWRLGKRTVFLGLDAEIRHRTLPWLAVLAAATALPAFGGMLLWGDASLRVFGIVACGLLGTAAICWLLLCGGMFFGSWQGILFRATLARVVLQSWIGGMLMLGLVIPCLRLEECHWVQRDHILEISADAPGICRYDHDLAAAYRKDLLQALDKLR
jgi:hypothetical protein